MRLDRASGVGEEAQRRCGGRLPRPASRGRAPPILPTNSDGHPSWGPASQTTLPASFVPTPQFFLAPVPKPVPSVNPMPSHPLATGAGGGALLAAPSTAPSREPAKPVSHPGAWSCTVSAACGLFACSVKTRHMTDGARLEWLGGLQGRVWCRSMKKAAVRACSGEPLVTGGPKDFAPARASTTGATDRRSSGSHSCSLPVLKCMRSGHLWHHTTCPSCP